MAFIHHCNVKAAVQPSNPPIKQTNATPFLWKPIASASSSTGNGEYASILR